MAFPLLSPPRLVQIDFSRAKECNLVDYPSNLAGMEVDIPASEPTELNLDGLDDKYASHTQVNEYIERFIRPLNDKVQSLSEPSHACGGVVSDLVKNSYKN